MKRKEPFSLSAGMGLRMLIVVGIFILHAGCESTKTEQGGDQVLVPTLSQLKWIVPSGGAPEECSEQTSGCK